MIQSVLRACLLAAVFFAMANGSAVAQGQGGVTIENAHARPMIGRTPNGVAYVTLKSTSHDRLLSAQSDVAEKVELHTHAQEGDVMRMRKIESIELPAGKVVRMAPGGLHVMLIDLTRKLKPGDTFELLLTFQRAGQIKVPVTVGDPSGGHKHGKKK